MRIHEKRPHKAGADLCWQAGNRRNLIAERSPHQDDLDGMRTHHLTRVLGIRPERASILAELAFGGAV